LLYFQFVVTAATVAAGATQSTPDHPSRLMIAMNWADALKR
jgi:hypothetical protein